MSFSVDEIEQVFEDALRFQLGICKDDAIFWSADLADLLCELLARKGIVCIPPARESQT